MATRPAPLIGAPPTLAGFDAEETIAQIAATLRGQVWNALRRRGLVVGMSGGVDSSVCAALAVEALGRESVLALMMPEADSEPESLASATEWAETLRIAHVVEDVTGALESLGCYRRRDEAVRRVVPEYGGGWRCKLVTGPGTGRLRGLSVHQLVVESPQGRTQRVRLDPLTYREIVAATNFKQRVRKTLEYHHADRLHYAVMGTPNRLEYDQGFFVKGGDGLADVKPIAHLYKTQVYELAVALGVPERTIRRPPTTDTYPLEQKQDEFYFRLPIEVLDGLLWACNSGMAPEEASHELGLPLDEVERAYAEIGGKRRATRYLHLEPLLAGGVPEVEQGSGARR